MRVAKLVVGERRVWAVRLLEVDLEVEALFAGAAQHLLDARRDALAGCVAARAVRRVDAGEAESFGMKRDVLPPEQVRLQPERGQRRRRVRHGKVPVEAVMREAEDAVVVRVEAGRQARAARAALRRG